MPTENEGGEHHPGRGRVRRDARGLPYRSPRRSLALWLLLSLSACGTDGVAGDSGLPAPAGDGAVGDGGSLGDGGPLEDGGLTDGGAPLAVLFVGNSYTDFHDLPEVVRALGEATPGGSVIVESVTQGGARLEDHGSTTGALARIAEGGRGAVVLQGQSLEPVFAPGDFLFYGGLLSDAVQEAGARSVWFATWARRGDHEVYVDSEFDPASLTEALESRYRQVADTHDDGVSRVGAAWLLAVAELPEVTLYADDGSHPTAAGTLLSACVILQSLTGLTPLLPDPPPLGIARETATALCDLAPRVRCPGGWALCEGECRHLAADPLHCGGCGEACDGEDPCRAGVCGCDGGLTSCGGVCTDLSTNPFRCGDCDVACDELEVCAAGECTGPSTSAPRVTLEELAAFDAACDGWDDAGTLACNVAAHAYCEAHACFDSGFGPPSGHAPRTEGVACVRGDVRTTTLAALEALSSGCDDVAGGAGQACTTAIHRHCASLGAVSGFGPVAAAGEEVTVTCVSSATVVRTTLDTLNGFASRCSADPLTCGAASWNFCASMGHPGGYGPVEVAGTDVDVVCFRP